MGSPPLCVLRHQVVAIALSLLFLTCGCCYSYLFSSTFVTCLALVVPISFPFIFNKIKQLQLVSWMKKTQKLEVGQELLPKYEVAEQKKVIQEEVDEFEVKELAASLPVRQSDCNSLKIAEINKPSPEKDCRLSAAWNGLYTTEMSLIPPRCSDCSLFNEEAPENFDQLTGCSDGLISDDDSLIEIALPDGHYVASDESSTLFRPNLRGGLLPEFLPEAVFRQHGLLELLSEINEEDNLIEIDINMGSIKCY